MLKELKEQGFILCDSKTLAQCKQSAIPETETEAEAEADTSLPKSEAPVSVPLVSEKSKDKSFGDFEIFWATYPKRDTDNKDNARKAWNKAKDKPAIDVILGKVEAYKQTDTVKRGYGQMASTWLNQKGWTMELISKSKMPYLPEKLNLGD